MNPVKDIENLDPAALLQSTEDPQITIPAGLSERLEDRLCAALLAEQGPDALAESPASARPHRPRRWLWGAVPAVALASLAVALLVRHPKAILQPMPPESLAETVAAYTEMENAFHSFSDAVQNAFDAFSTSYSDKTNHPSL